MIALIRCTADTLVPHSRAVLMIPGTPRQFGADRLDLVPRQRLLSDRLATFGAVR
jgi:hypothetical protein